GPAPGASTEAARAPVTNGGPHPLPPLPSPADGTGPHAALTGPSYEPGPAFDPGKPPPRAAMPSTSEAEPAGAAADHPLVLRLPVGTRLADAERKLILLTLEAVRGNKQRAARVLGISRRGL